MGPINNIPALVQIMAWRRPGDKPLSGPMMFRLLTHICVTRPQWVKLSPDESCWGAWWPPVHPHLTSVLLAARHQSSAFSHQAMSCLRWLSGGRRLRGLRQLIPYVLVVYIFGVVGITRYAKQHGYITGKQTQTGEVCERLIGAKTSWPLFHIKMSSDQYTKSHCGNKTVVRSSHLHHGIFYTGKTTSFYWTRVLVS